MKNLFYILMLMAAVMTGCTKTEPEPEPAEQIIGTYDVKSYSISVNGQLYDGYEFPAVISEKDSITGKITNYEVTQIMDVLKKSSNSVSMNITTNEKNISTGKTDTYKDPFDDVELKKNTSGSFDMIDNNGKTVGTATKDEINYGDQSETTLNGQKVTVRFTLKAKRKV